MRQILWEPQLLEIGSAGLRCGRWAWKHRKEEKSKGQCIYHLGKFYAYMYVLSMVKMVVMPNPHKIPNYEEWLQTEFKDKGMVRCFKGCFDFDVIMKKAFLELILGSDQPHQGKIISKEIRELCPEIK